MILPALLLAAAAVAASPSAVQALVPAGRQPRVAVSPDGASAALTFGLKDDASGTVYCMTSADGGATWSPPILVGTVPGLALGMRRGPQVAVGGGRITVAACSHTTGELIAWTSTTGGASWSAPVTVNDAAKSAEEGLHAVAAAPDGTVLAVWLDHRNGNGQALEGARLEPGATTWTANQLVYASPDGKICDCCHPFVTTDAAGNFFTAWRNAIAGARDLYLAVSRDGGRTFGEGRKLGKGTWKIDGCPMDGPWVAAASPDQVVTAWRRLDRVYRSNLGMPEASLGTGKQPAVALGLGGEFEVWNRDGDLRLLSPTRDTSESLGAGAYPAIAAPPDGRGPVIAAWESPDGGIAVRRWPRAIH
jgi:hypothetical protein